MGKVNLLIAFLGGLISFFSPCVLPLVPVFLGLWLGSVGSKRQLVLSSSLFVLGFSIVFVLLGFSAGVVGKLILSDVARVIFGLLIIFFGLSLAQIVSVPIFKRDFRPFLHAQTITPFKSFMVGLGFALGWSPCVGPVLGSILLVASQTGNELKAAVLLFSFALGMGVPFILGAFLSGFLLRMIRNLTSYIPVFQLLSGKFLAFLGFGLMTGFLKTLSEITELSVKLLLAFFILLLVAIIEIRLLMLGYKNIADLAKGDVPLWFSYLFFIDFYLFVGLYFVSKFLNA